MFNISSLFISTFLSLLHPFFVSVIDIKHNPKDKNVEISVRIFTDDIEKIIKKNSKKTIDLSSNTAKAENDAMIDLYLKSKLQFAINNKAQMWKYIGYEIQKESVWIYAEIDDVASLKKLDIKCSLLFDYQSKQTNIFNVIANGTEKNYKLDYPKSNVSFEW